MRVCLHLSIRPYVLPEHIEINELSYSYEIGIRLELFSRAFISSHISLFLISGNMRKTCWNNSGFFIHLRCDRAELCTTFTYHISCYFQLSPAALERAKTIVDSTCINFDDLVTHAQTGDYPFLTPAKLDQLGDFS